MCELRENAAFKAQDYGLDQNLVGCPLTMSIGILRELNYARSPFEIVMILQKVHKKIAEEMEEYSLIRGNKITINGDIVISALMSIFIKADIKFAIEKMLYVQYFSYIDYSISEVFFIIGELL